MVRALSCLLLLLYACATREGTVLIARDSERDAGPSSEEDLDAGDNDAGESDAESASDARVDTRGHCRIGGSKDGFYENFSGKTLDPTRWLVAHGPVELAGQRAAGGFARDNVSVEADTLVLRVRGDQYEGPVRAVDSDGRPLSSGKRSAAALVTRDLFASATYQVQGHFVGPSGVEVALWFTHDDDKQGAITLATPGLDGTMPSYAFLHLQTRDGSASASNEFALGASLDDRASHILRFDWYTTADNAAVFWLDDTRRFQSTKNLPSRRAGRLWIVAWLREPAPAAFDTAEIHIESAFVTPFGNDGDACTDGELEGPFLTLP
jgi:hypothetical protein